MRWAVKVGSVRGIAVHVHFTFLFLLAFLLVANTFTRGAPAGLRNAFLIVLIFVCVLLHELAHSAVCARYGLRVRSIVLLPIGGLAQLDDVPRTPHQEIAIAVAGPVANGLLALVLGAAFYHLGLMTSFRPPVLAGEYLAPSLFWANVYLALFNLIPAYPLDGGRILRGWLAARMDYLEATHKAVAVGQFFAFVFIFVGLFADWWLILIGLFVYAGAVMEERQTLLHAALEQIHLEDVMLTRFNALAPADSISDALDQALHSLQDVFPVVEAGSVVGVVSKAGLVTALRHEGWNHTVRAVMSQRFESAEPGESLANAFRKFSARGLALLVVEAAGRLVGIVTPQNLLHSVALLSRKGAAEFDFLRRG